MNDYRTVASEATAVYEEKRSRFIAKICRAEDEATAKEVVAATKKLHYDARHNTYAYIIAESDNLPAGCVKSSDDGEPAGTAGMPILNVIKNHGLKNVVIVVTRYFGGIKLGAAGLLRAYSQAANMSVAAAKIVDIKSFLRLNVGIDYTFFNSLQSFARQKGILTEEAVYTENVTLPLLVEESTADDVIAAVADITSGAATVTSGGMVTREISVE